MNKRIKARRAVVRGLRRHFKKHLLILLSEAQRRSGDSLGDVFDLIEYLGVDEVIQLLVSPEEVDNPPDGFVRLMRSDLARYTIEQALIDFEGSSLLTRLQVETARARLAAYSGRDNRR